MPHKAKKFENQKFDNKHFRVTIFGSARIKPGDETYQQVFSFAKTLGKEGFDVITGGGPGVMQAGNAGHMAGDKNNKARSIGISIELPFEQHSNPHLEIEKKFKRFSGRLDQFMALSSAVVLFPGGIGTCLELFYTWQLVQVKHICPIPIILIGKQWEKLIDWVKQYPLEAGLVSAKDLDHIHVVHENDEALEVLKNAHEAFVKARENPCTKTQEYEIE